jgi:hypothetical protein
VNKEGDYLKLCYDDPSYILSSLQNSKILNENLIIITSSRYLSNQYPHIREPFTNLPTKYTTIKMCNWNLNIHCCGHQASGQQLSAKCPTILEKERLISLGILITEADQQRYAEICQSQTRIIYIDDERTCVDCVMRWVDNRIDQQQLTEEAVQRLRAEQRADWERQKARHPPAEEARRRRRRMRALE